MRIRGGWMKERRMDEMEVEMGEGRVMAAARGACPH